MIKFSENTENAPQILVLGIGGAGGSVIDKINNYNMAGIQTFFIDTDQDTVNGSTAKEKICLPTRLVKELSSEIPNTLAGQELGKELKAFVDLLPKAEIVFTISGLGGNTGTVLAPLLLQLLRERSFWTWPLVTLPFFFEGKPKILNSLKRLKLVQQYADALLVIPHDKIFKMVDKTLSMKEAFTPANNLCAELVADVNRLTSGSWVNIKFSDIKERTIKKKSTSFGIGAGSGEARLQMAIEQAISSPLLGREILSSAEGLIVSIIGSEDLTLDEVNRGIEYLRTLIAKDIDIAFGVSMDPALKGNVKVGVIATGIEASSNVDNWGLYLSTKDTGLVKRTPYLTRPLQQLQKARQTMIDFKKVSKGRFEKSEATIYGGEDLDVPAFMRRKKQG